MDTDHVFLDILIGKKDKANQCFPITMTLTWADGTRQEYPDGTLQDEILNWVRYSLDEQVSGGALFDMLFKHSQLRENWTGVRRIQQPYCHIRIGFADDESLAALHTIPWELLHDTTDIAKPYLAANRTTPFSRYVRGISLGRAVDMRPLKLLVAVASPQDLPEDMAPVEVEVEQSIISDAMADLTNGQVDITLVEQPITLDKLETLLASEIYHILHIVGHGRFLASYRGDGKPHAFLYLATAANTVKEVMDTDFAAMLQRLGNRQPQFIFLASCQTAKRPKADPFQGFAPALLKIGVPAVLAMQENIHIPTARTFTKTFYRELFRDGYVDLASNVARATVLTNELHGSYVPVLFSRLPNNRLLLPQANAVFERLCFEPETVYIRAGKFWMGSDEGTKYEAPKHEVELPAYRIGKYPVTNAEYAQFIRQTGRSVAPETKGFELAEIGQKPRSGLENHPVVGITWDDAVAYCHWLTTLTGRTYRLPSEAEWEKAARGIDGRTYPWGNAIPDKILCTFDKDQKSGTEKVSEHPEGASPYGCLDLAGNVWEWTNTCWGTQPSVTTYPYPYKANDGREDSKASTGPYREYRICRGGSYTCKVTQVTCTTRTKIRANERSGERGFRIVQNLQSDSRTA